MNGNAGMLLKARWGCSVKQNPSKHIDVLNDTEYFVNAYLKAVSRTPNIARSLGAIRGFLRYSSVILKCG